MEYAFRKSALENEKNYRIEQDYVLVEDLKTGSKNQIAFRDIKSIHLKYLAKRNMPDAYLCTIISRNGSKLVLSSQHYKGIASFENRDESYAQFVTTLHSLLKNEELTYSKGIGAFGYWISMIFFIFAGLVIAAISLTALIPYGIVTLLVLIYIFFRLKKHYKINKPGSYNPIEIPKELLP
jgi:hypothetical protein